MNDTTQVITEAERIIDKYSEKAYDAIEGLAEQLKIPAEHIYQVLTKQYAIEGISFFIIVSIFIILMLIGYKNIIKHYKLYKKDCKEAGGKDKYDDSYDIGDSPNGVVVIIISIITGIIFVITASFFGAYFYENFTKIINPEYWVIQEILETIK